MKYIASCSFGKDSLATIILAYLHNEPLDEVVYARVMFDSTTSAEISKVQNKASPRFNRDYTLEQIDQLLATKEAN